MKTPTLYPASSINNTERRSAAFTLLEVTITVAILAVVSAVVVVNYRVPIDNARAEAVFERIDQFDQRVRLWTQMNRASATVRINLDRGIFQVESNGSPIATIPALELGHGIKLGEFRVAGQARFGGDTSVPYTTQGVAPLWSYSLILPDGRERFRLMLGATGQSVEVDDEDELQVWENFLTK